MRIASFNVHYWTDRAMRPTVDETLVLLRELRCDVIVLQEVPDGCKLLPQVADALGMHRAFAPASELGNALLSRDEPQFFAVHQLATPPSEARSGFVAVLPWEGGSFTLVGTHLDVESEHVRVRQLDRLLAATNEIPDRGAMLLAGDFNSLRLSDYNDATLERIRVQRVSAGLEPPLGAVTIRIMDAGFVDLWRAANGAEHAMNAEVLATCWVGTRIDYLWANRAFAARARLVRCRHVPTKVSDHNPVVADFVLSDA